MRRIIFFLVCILFLNRESFAAVRLRWTDINTERAPVGLRYLKKDFETILIEVGKVFSDKYCDLGDRNILECSKTFELMFHSGDAPEAETILGDSKMDMIYLNPRLLGDKTMNDIRVIVFHELSHFYDNLVADDLERRGQVSKAREIRKNSENRAKKKTLIYKKSLSRQ